MIRIAVVDDEPLSRRGVIAQLAAFDDLLLAAEYEDGPSALAGMRDTPPDLVFLDVQMPGMNGLDVLAALPPARRPLAILVTAHEGFAVRGFALNAVDYLLKPLDDVRFGEAVARARDLLQLRMLKASPATPAVVPSLQPVQKFQVRVGSRTLFIHADMVQWIGADGDYAALHVGARTYLLRESLHQLATQLDPARFVRVHRSSIVRLDQVAELQPLTNRDALLRLHDGTPVRVSRSYIDTLLSALHAAG